MEIGGCTFRIPVIEPCSLVPVHVIIHRLPVHLPHIVILDIHLFTSLQAWSRDVNHDGCPFLPVNFYGRGVEIKFWDSLYVVEWLTELGGYDDEGDKLDFRTCVYLEGFVAGEGVGEGYVEEGGEARGGGDDFHCYCC